MDWQEVSNILGLVLGVLEQLGVLWMIQAALGAILVLILGQRLLSVIRGGGG